MQGMDLWWELATLVTIMLLGHWLEIASVANAQDSLRELAKLLPDEAELLTDNETKKVPTAALRVSDIVLVRPGAQIPADGYVVKGQSAVNEAILTGESQSVSKTIHAAVIGGTINGNGGLTVQVTKVGDDTTLAGIMRLVTEAQNSTSGTQILADRAAFYLTFIAIGAAIVTGIAWTLAGQSTAFILERIVTVLVVACPHALGLAIPLVVAIATSLAAKNGLLVRRRSALETARAIDIVLFDKTGTLTEGKQSITDIVAIGDKNTLLQLAASIESESEHSIGRAITAEAKTRELRMLAATELSVLPGRGVRAIVSGATVYAGSARLVADLQAVVPKAIEQATASGNTIVYVVKETTVIGVITLGDALRSQSRAAVTSLRADGKRVAMLTGDSHEAAAQIAAELGITEYYAEILPEHKVDIIKKLESKGDKVAMVGDGVNDAPALAQATIGIAIGAGTDVAIESADIVLAASDPQSVAKIMTLSKVTYRKMQQNLAWAVGYNALALPLAAGVIAPLGFVLSPAFGAVLMSASTIIVAANAQFLRKTFMQ
jgi:Cu2+-exporting ATPase